ncbi:cellulase family glycosylhydrolase [Chitinolyticbacter albus]|uniref:cellulase family glycosylhydrolase n=1 Tax=Chitinolyticbacter albus TaxID=2961951 RepID=UPI0025464DB6|nr:cellulase family glycosylhydrolase [Chitinolyticbacter albus]
MRGLKHLILPLSLGLISATTLANSNFLKTDGRLVRNGNGDVVYLRGVNLGGWFVHEPWMTPLQGANDEWTMRQTLTNRFGAAQAQALINTYRDSWIKEQDFQKISEVGMNVVRLPLYWQDYMNLDGSWKYNAQGQIDFASIEKAVEWARKHRLYVILDLHGAPGSQNGQDHSGKIGSADLWKNESYRQMTVNFWRELARRFAGNATVAGYDVLNEPSENFPSQASGPSVWNLYDRVYDAIRAVDPDHIIILEGIWDWAAIPHPNSYGWSNVIYEFHYYLWGNDNNSAAQASFVESKINQEQQYLGYNVPHYVGEFNFFGLKDGWDYGLRRYNEAGWHWTNWSYKATNMGNWALYNGTNAAANKPNVATDSYATIESKWRNWDTDAHMAPNQGLIDSLRTAVRSGNGLIRNLPYSGSILASSTIEAEYAYQQRGTSQEGGVVGYFDNGDWLRFIDVNFGSGANRLRLRLAVDAAYAGKQIELRLGSPTGTLLATHTVASTGGWGNYAEQVVNLSQNVSGIQNVYLVGKGGDGIANLDWLRFESSAVTPTPTPTASPTPTPVTPMPTATPAPTPVTPAPVTPLPSLCYAAWGTGAVYMAGQRVTHAGRNYEAKWWTQGDNPAQAGNWGVWRNLGVCGSTPATPAPTPLPTPVATPRPTSQPTPVGQVCNAAWREGDNYTTGQQVSYNGHNYVALVSHTAYVGTGWNPAASPTLWHELGAC